jgi:hypothetical protein
MIGVIMTYVIPKFAELYSDLNVPLPATDRHPDQGGNHDTVANVRHSSCAGDRDHWPLDVDRHEEPDVCGSTDEAKTPCARESLDDVLHGAALPYRWQCCFRAVLPLLTALEVTRDASGNSVISSSIAFAIKEVREGKSLSDSLEKTGHFPTLSLEMMRVGEQTGSLPEMLNHVADFVRRGCQH